LKVYSLVAKVAGMQAALFPQPWMVNVVQKPQAKVYKKNDYD
jgi:hypothetical protein